VKEVGTTEDVARPHGGNGSTLVPLQQGAIVNENTESLIEQTPPGPRPQRWKWLLRTLREVAETVIPAVVIALIINVFLAQATQVLGQSMEPNLHTSQRVVVEKVTYRFLHGPRRGDVVVLNLPEQPDMLIKRVIGLPGETIEVRDGQVYIDGEPIHEPWTTNPGGGYYGPVTVPPLHVFVMGDNRSASNDSRSFGPVSVDAIIGRAWFSYWPPKYIGFVE
jgi:signal peptidase I